MVSTRTSTGSIGVLANHAPLMAILEPTELRLYKSESEIVRFAQGEGYLQVVDNSALVLVEDAIAPDSIDRSAFESRLKEARESMERAEEGLRGAGAASARSSATRRSSRSAPSGRSRPAPPGARPAALPGAAPSNQIAASRFARPPRVAQLGSIIDPEGGHARLRWAVKSNE